MKMDSTTLSIIACVIAIGVGIGMFVMYKKRLIDKEMIEGVAALLRDIEIPDVLYGVTMQEQGISKLLRLDLNQMEQYLGIVE